MQATLASTRKANRYFTLILLGMLAALLFAYKPIILVSLLVLLLAAIFLWKIEWILYITIFVAYTRADAWLSFNLHLPFGTFMVLLILASLGCILLFTNLSLNKPDRSFFILSLFFALCFLIGSLLGDKSYISEWLRDSSYAFIAFMCIFLLAADEKRLDLALKTVVIMGILLSLANILELFSPGSLRMSHSVGRSAGFLKNANASAFAIIACFLIYSLFCDNNNNLAVSLKKFFIQTLFFIGVLSTFSREGTIFLLIAFMGVNIIYMRNKSPVYVNYLSLIFTGVTSYYLLNFLMEFRSDIFISSYGKIYSLFHGNLDDNFRLYLLKYYMTRLIDGPLAGYGFYASIKPSLANSSLLSRFGVLGPHNTPVAIAVDFGFLPLLLYTTLYASVISSLRALSNKMEAHILLLLVSLLILHNFFVHDFLTTRYIMVLLGLICAFSAVRRRA